MSPWAFYPGVKCPTWESTLVINAINTNLNGEWMQLLSMDDSSKPFSLVPNPWLLPLVWAQDWSQHTSSEHFHSPCSIAWLRTSRHWLMKQSGESYRSGIWCYLQFTRHKNSMRWHSSLEGDILFLVPPGLFMYHPLSTFLYLIWTFEGGSH